MELMGGLTFTKDSDRSCRFKNQVRWEPLIVNYGVQQVLYNQNLLQIVVVKLMLSADNLTIKN